MLDDGFRLLPEQASTLAPRVDLLYYFLLAMSAFFTVMIATLIVYFSIKYRRGNQHVEHRRTAHTSLLLEVTWIGLPLLLSITLFVWGAGLYFHEYHVP